VRRVPHSTLGTVIYVERFVRGRIVPQVSFVYASVVNARRQSIQVSSDDVDCARNAPGGRFTIA
jgi:hypothetical protein